MFLFVGSCWWEESEDWGAEGALHNAIGGATYPLPILSRSAGNSADNCKNGQADILLGQIPADNSVQQTFWVSSRQFVSNAGKGYYFLRKTPIF